tara:strand:+ start:233 stop:424 length:192 start_codon:yes stop_codon:yes gene_type:complete
MRKKKMKNAAKEKTLGPKPREEERKTGRRRGGKSSPETLASSFARVSGYEIRDAITKALGGRG